MHELEELKELLCKELKKYGKKSEITGQSLEVVDKLAHALKNLDKVIESYDAGHSERGSYRSMPYWNMYDGDDWRSYARRRDSMGRYSREDGYSGAESMIAELRDLMNEAKDDRTRAEFKRFIDKMETIV